MFLKDKTGCFRLDAVAAVLPAAQRPHPRGSGVVNDQEHPNARTPLTEAEKDTLPGTLVMVGGQVHLTATPYGEIVKMLEGG